MTALDDSGLYFDFIGMDACIMASLEVCCAFYDYCDYTVLSEDFESGLGWSYTNFLSMLMKNSSASTYDLAKQLIDDTIAANEEDSENGSSSIMSLIDEAALPALYRAWTAFAYANESSLTSENYSQAVTKSSRLLPALIRPHSGGEGMFSDWMEDEDSAVLSDYYITDIMAVAQNITSDESSALSEALSDAILYTASTESDAGLTGLSVTLPYGDSEFYSELKTIFTNVGFDSEYVDWLGSFVSASGTSAFYDYDDWNQEWSGWDTYNDGDWNYAPDDDFGYGPGDDRFDDYYDDGYYDDYYDDGYYDDYYDDGYYDDRYYDDYYDDGYYDDYYDDGYYDDGYYDDGYYDDYYDDFRRHSVLR